MKHLCCSIALLTVLVSGGVAALPAVAQGTAARPNASNAIDPRAVELVQRARAVMNDVQSMTYRAEVVGNMPDGNRQSVVKTEVVAERGEQPGQWKFLVEGDFAIEPKSGGRREGELDVRAAFDGNEVSVVDNRRRLVRIQETKDPEVVRVTMNQGNAATSVAWELFGETVLNGSDLAIKAELEAPQTVDGLECEVVWFVPPKTKSAGGTVHESAIVPSKIFFAKRDGMPRRFEVYRPATAGLPADKRGEPTRRMTIVGTEREELHHRYPRGLQRHRRRRQAPRPQAQDRRHARNQTRGDRAGPGRARHTDHVQVAAAALRERRHARRHPGPAL